MPEISSQTYPSRIGLIAGSGEYPILLARQVIQKGTEIVAIGFPGITSLHLKEILPQIHWIPFGQFQTVVQIFVSEGIKHAIFAGKVPQSIIFKSKEFDYTAQSILKKLPNQQTDSLIGAAANAFATFGVTFIDARSFLEDFLADEGPMTHRKPSEIELLDIHFGFRMAKHIALEDIGQTVIVKQKAVLAVEAIEGTDQAILRAAQFGGEGITVVKVSKPKQDFRFDVPVVGMDTLEIMVKVKASILAVDSKKTLILHKPQVIKKANELDLCIYGVMDKS